MPDAKAYTLLRIIRREVAVASMTHTDEWSTYRLEQHGYKPFKVNHRKCFVNVRTYAGDREAMIRAEDEEDARNFAREYCSGTCMKHSTVTRQHSFSEQVLIGLRDV